jgi:hypothetical protein
MSYDIDIGRESFNYTSNVARIFYDHIPAADDAERGGLHRLNGLTGKQAGAVLRDAFDAIDRSVMRDWICEDVGEPNFCKRYDSPNGWGSALGALVFLSRVMAACYANPRLKVRVDA